MKSNHKSFDWNSFISQHPLFGELLVDEINSLLESNNSTHREFKKGNVIFRAGELSNSFFLIGKGSVNVELLSEGSTAINIDTLYKGGYFGEMSAIDNQSSRAATISANENCILLEIKSRPFQKVLKTNPELEFKLLSMMAARLRHVNDYLLKSTHLTYDSKFALLSEKIESQSKVVDASLKASQAVFEQSKIRTDEVINAAERGRSRITFISSTLTGAFTTILAVLSFLGIDSVTTIKTAEKDVEIVQSKIEASGEEIEKTKKSVNVTQEELNKTIASINDSIETAQIEVEGVKSDIMQSGEEIEKIKKSVNVTKEELDKTIASINDSISDSNKAKKILFESLISLYMIQVEAFIKPKAEQAAIVNPSNLAEHILEIKDPFITKTLFRKLFYAIVDSQQEKNELNEARKNYFAFYMDQYISTEDALLADNHLAQFLSRYILLVTDTMLKKDSEDDSESFNIQLIEVNSESFNFQLNELKTKYNQIVGDEELKNLKDFITETAEITAYTARIDAVKNTIDMP